MRQFLQLLLLAILVGPQVGPLARPLLEAFGHERKECCEPAPECSDACSHCTCCTSRVIAQLAMADSAAQDIPTDPHGMPRSSDPSSAPSFEILHVPRSG